MRWIQISKDFIQCFEMTIDEKLVFNWQSLKNCALNAVYHPFIHVAPSSV
jgi:hypothetical protein